MPNTKYLANKRLTILIGLVSANPFADPSNPSDVELATLKNISPAVRVNGYAFGMQATPDTDDRSFEDAPGAQGDGFLQFGGDVPVYTPTDYTNTADILQQVWALTKAQGTALWVATRLGPINSGAIAVGDIVSVYKVLTDGSLHNTEGVGGRVRILTFQPNGDIFPNRIVKHATTPVVITQTVPATAQVGKPFYGKAVAGGRDITRDAVWTSTDPTKVFIAEAGVFVPLAAGTASIQATYAGMTPGTTTAVTVS